MRASYRCEPFVSTLLFHSWPQIVQRVAVHCKVHQAAMQEGRRYQSPVLSSRDQAIHLHNIMLLSATIASIPKDLAHKNISKKCNDAVAFYNTMVFASRGTVHRHTLAPHIMRPPLLRICAHGTADSVRILLSVCTPRSHGPPPKGCHVYKKPDSVLQVLEVLSSARLQENSRYLRWDESRACAA